MRMPVHLAPVLVEERKLWEGRKELTWMKKKRDGSGREEVFLQQIHSRAQTIGIQLKREHITE